VRLRKQVAAGWTAPAGAVDVARPSTWSNPFHVDGVVVYDATSDEEWPCASHAEAVQTALFLFETVVVPTLDLTALRGRDLCCWCEVDTPCHADALLKLSNA
jgi:hypothetical protein